MALHAPAGPFTWDDLAQMPDDGYRRELIHDQLLVTPRPWLGTSTPPSSSRVCSPMRARRT